jgi:hypothetical protein
VCKPILIKLKDLRRDDAFTEYFVTVSTNDRDAGSSSLKLGYATSCVCKNAEVSWLFLRIEKFPTIHKKEIKA